MELELMQNIVRVEEVFTLYVKGNYRLVVGEKAHLKCISLVDTSL
ncbi:hypothetical protein GALL_551960 [mine drainage metagenome]|uniref:Uncharacterized protein n=1 Tax=mine drainage metagenome TaxID=410659 RepID=A0A1J5P611_9ZZZZ